MLLVGRRQNNTSQNNKQRSVRSRSSYHSILHSPESNMKIKTGKGNWSSRTNKLGFPYVFLICISFFLAGFFGSTLFSHFQDDGDGLRPRPRLLESKKEMEYDLLPAGESGDDSITSIPFQVLSWKPRALYFPNFATAEQCEGIIDIAKAGLKPSALALRKGETEESTKGTRTSSGMFISASEDKTGLLGVIEEKIARATMIPRKHGEVYIVWTWFFNKCRLVPINNLKHRLKWLGFRKFPSVDEYGAISVDTTKILHLMTAFNILRYEIGQRYNSHYDAFNPAEYGPQKSQRMASFLLYLSDVQEGGETMFPFENGLNMDGSYGYEDCIGLKVRPRQGDGLLFYSLFPNGTIDPMSLHGSCPVIKGEKWVATKWIRDIEQGDDY